MPNKARCTQILTELKPEWRTPPGVEAGEGKKGWEQVDFLQGPHLDVPTEEPLSLAVWTGVSLEGHLPEIP